MNPRTTVFAFDLHGVIFTRDYSQMFKILWKTPHKFKLLWALCSPSLWLDTIKLMYNKGVAEQFIIGLADKHTRLQPFVPLGITIANTQKPVIPVLRLLWKLKAKGYQLHVFSNIGSIVLADLQPRHPEVFALISSITVPSQENGYTRKPSEQSFQNFFANSKASAENIIFIDDSRSNTRAAQQYGIRGIYFKSPEQLSRDLLALGI